MKIKIINFAIILALTASILSGCAKKEYRIKTTQNPLPDHADSLRIAIASDLHVGAVDAGSISFEGNFAPEILDVFAEDIQNENVDLLVLSGDISNSARYTHHQQLIDKLHEIENSGITVCVAVGNHDIGQMKEGEFATYYADFGYNEAYSRDENSLSYAVVVNGVMLVVLDTDGYTDYRYACLSPKTLSWAKSVFDFAAENDMTVLPVGHYPLLRGHTTEFIGADDAKNLFKKYNVPLYVSGHLHNRNVTVDGNLSELVVEQLTSYPCSYALLDIDHDGAISYHPQKLNVSQWAQDNGVSNELLLNFEDLGSKSAQRSNEKLIETLSKKHYASQSDKKKRYEFFNLLSECMADGSVYSNREMLQSHPGYSVFIRICQDSNYAPWIPSLFESANPYTQGFVIKSGEIKGLD